MAFYQILSEKELQIAPVGLYYVAGDDGSYVETEKDGVAQRLMARVREETDLPKGVQGIVARADGKQIVKDWVRVSVVDAAPVDAMRANADALDADLDHPVESVPCPLCGAMLMNKVLANLTVCPNCSRTIALMNGRASVATGAETTQLSQTTIAALKAMRVPK